MSYLKVFLCAFLTALAVDGSACTPEQASWRVRVQTGQGTAYGSATAIGPQVMVTAGHMSDGKAGVEMDMFGPDGKTVHGHVIAVQADPLDIEVVYLDSSVGENYVPLGNQPKVGETVSEFGYGHLGILRTGTGTVTESLGKYEFQSTIVIESGDSGCGVFDQYGRIIGINTACRGSAKTPDGKAHTGPSISTGINWIANFSNIDVGCPGGVCPIRPQPIGNQMQPVLPSPPQFGTVPNNPALPPVIGGGQGNVTPKDIEQDGRLNGLEAWVKGVNDRANPLLGKYGQAPLPTLPLAGNTQPLPPPLPPITLPSPDLSGIKEVVKPIIDDAVSKLQGQLNGHLKDLPDQIKEVAPKVAGDVINQIQAHPEIISAVVGPLVAGLGLPAWAGMGVTTGVGALLAFFIHKKAGGTTIVNPPSSNQQPSIINVLPSAGSIPAAPPQVVAASNPPVGGGYPVVVQSAPLPQEIVTQTSYVPYETGLYQEAFTWASEQRAKKYPGEVSTLEGVQSLMAQYIAGKKKN